MTKDVYNDQIKLTPWQLLVLPNFYCQAVISELPMAQWELYHALLFLDRYLIGMIKKTEQPDVLQRELIKPLNQAFTRLMKPLYATGTLTTQCRVTHADQVAHMKQINAFIKAVMPYTALMSHLKTIVNKLLRLFINSEVSYANNC